MKTINLEKILDLFIGNETCTVQELYEGSIKAMKEACKQTLELAAENAKCLDVNRNINKQSILDTINQVK